MSFPQEKTFFDTNQQSRYSHLFKVLLSSNVRMVFQMTGSITQLDVRTFGVRVSFSWTIYGALSNFSGACTSRVFNPRYHFDKAILIQEISFRQCS